MASPTSEPSWTIRTAVEEDLEQALDVLEAVAEERVYIGTEPPIDRESRLEKWRGILARPRETMLVVVAGDRVVGSGDIQWAGVSEVGMALAPGWRGRGIGAALLEALVSWAEADGSHKVELRVWPHNAAAIALYEKFGFEREGYLVRHYRRSDGELWDCIIMGLQLPRPT